MVKHNIIIPKLIIIIWLVSLAFGQYNIMGNETSKTVNPNGNEFHFHDTSTNNINQGNGNMTGKGNININENCTYNQYPNNNSSNKDNNSNYIKNKESLRPRTESGSLSELKLKQNNGKWNKDGIFTGWDDNGSFGSYKPLGINGNLRLGTYIDGIQFSNDGSAILNVEPFFTFEEIKLHVEKILNYNHIGWNKTNSTAFIGEVAQFVECEYECLKNNKFDGSPTDWENRHKLRWMDRCKNIVNIANDRDFAKAQVNSKLDDIRKARKIPLRWQQG